MMYRLPRMGRKLVMMVSSALMGISIFLFSAVNDQASNIGLNAMEYFFQSEFRGQHDLRWHLCIVLTTARHVQCRPLRMDS